MSAHIQQEFPSTEADFEEFDGIFSVARSLIEAKHCKQETYWERFYIYQRMQDIEATTDTEDKDLIAIFKPFYCPRSIACSPISLLLYALGMKEEPLLVEDGN